MTEPIEDEDEAPVGGTATQPMSVSAVNGLVNFVLSEALPNTFFVAGEISNFRTYDRGHAFFTLKEAGAELPCVMWKDALARLKIKPRDGMAVIARGAIKLYEPQGKLQLYVESLTTIGAGALEAAFRKLCEKLRAEGLFEQSRKRSIPKLPRRIVIITSRTGDVLHDVLTTAYRRFPGLHTMLFPVRVQGPSAAAEIATAIKLLNVEQSKMGGGENQKSKIPSIDLILLVRGGGSLEDLWPFNDEFLARAIVASKIPIATGIGHEPDMTIADLVGDLRGPTPTGITELTIPDVRSLLASLDSSAALLTRDIHRALAANRNLLERSDLRLTQAARNRLRTAETRLDALRKQIERIEPRHAIAQGWRRIEDAQHRLGAAVEKRFALRIASLQRMEHRLEKISPAGTLPALRARVEALHDHLRAVSPQAVLERGYSITKTADGRIVRSVAEVKKGDLLNTRVADGTIASTVGKPRQDSLF